MVSPGSVDQVFSYIQSDHFQPKFLQIDFWSSFLLDVQGYTVDGSEILRSPVEVDSLSHYLKGFIHSQVVFSPDF